MARIVLIHWNAAEAAERAERLRRAGHEVETISAGGGDGLRGFRSTPPDAFVIDLERLPSQGQAVATFLRQQKGTRRVPIVFVGGTPEKVRRARTLLPDATYADWKGIRGALRRAMAKPPERPAVPGTMAGYSGTPLPKKLGIKPDSTLVLLLAPADFETTLGALPAGTRIVRRAGGKGDRVILFARSRAELVKRWPIAARTLAEGGGLWIAWPKRTSGIASDLSEVDVRGHGLRSGFVDYKICAIDATWSGLQFARRRVGGKDRG